MNGANCLVLFYEAALNAPTWMSAGQLTLRDRAPGPGSRASGWVRAWLEGAGPSKAGSLGNDPKVKPGKVDLQKLSNSPISLWGWQTGDGLTRLPSLTPDSKRQLEGGPVGPVSSPAPAPVSEHPLSFLKTLDIEVPQGQFHAVLFMTASSVPSSVSGL